jgi:hypothetical protein
MIHTKVTAMRMAALNATKLGAIFVIIFLCNQIDFLATELVNHITLGLA